MRTDILDIQDKIKSGRFANEAAVSQGMVRRILDLLSWPVYDTDVVWPEYVLEGTRVDYALCHPPRKPILFIEVKQVGQGSYADRQLFEYAFHRGVPMAILTDGQEWHFFLPAERGDYAERRVYKLDILEREPDESLGRLKRYLDYSAVCSGVAIQAAREDYRDVAKERDIRATFPEAWTRLLEDGDDLLLELVADKVESLCGYKPELNKVAAFLTESLVLKLGSHQAGGSNTAITVPRQPTMVRPTRRPSHPAGIGFNLLGQHFSGRSAIDVLQQVFQQLAKRDPSFLERFAALPKHGRTRRYLARSRNELYPGRPDLMSESSRELWTGSGWWIGTNLSAAQILKIIKMACDVGGLTYGTDLRVSLE